MMANKDIIPDRGLFRSKLLPFVLIGFFSFVILSIFYPAIPLFHNDLDTEAIEQAVQLSYEINGMADCTLDDSRMREVYANDIRGGIREMDDVRLVRAMTGNPVLPRWQIGALDVQHALFAYWRRAKLLYDEAVATGAYPDDVSTYQIPEIKALGEAVGGRSPVLPQANCTYSIAEYSFQVLGVKTTLLRNFAFATIDFRHFTSRLVFVKEDGQWKIAGGKVIRWHKG